MDVLTAGGEIRLLRRYYWSKEAGGACPADGLAGIETSSLSPGARELSCLMGIGQDFEQACRDLKRVGGLSLSKERLRQVVELESRQARGVRDSGELPPAWSAEEAKLEDGRSRVYAGVDGVMAPTVTQVEKDKRRKAHAVRRQQRSASGVGNLKPLPPTKPGSDERFKEMKIGLFYDQDKSRRHAFVSPADGKAFGALLGAHAESIHLDRADEKLSLTDGAKWIFKQIVLWLLCLDAVMLDFYHLAQHVHEAARRCLGENEAARAWAADRLHEIKASGPVPVLEAIESLGRRVRAPAKKKSLQALKNYLHKRKEMVNYPCALARGWDIGSGPTEAVCKTLTLRLKRPGMKWDRDNASGIMNLLAMRESGQWQTYWRTQAAA